jgi:uncharacterized protein (UPF0216 family)
MDDDIKAPGRTMTTEELARQAGYALTKNDGQVAYWCTREILERFAALVRADERRLTLEEAALEVGSHKIKAPSYFEVNERLTEAAEAIRALK